MWKSYNLKIFDISLYLLRKGLNKLIYLYRKKNCLCFEGRVSDETWQLVNSLECLLPLFIKLFNTKDNNKNIIYDWYYSKINFKVKCIWAKDFLTELNCKQPLTSKTLYKRRHSKLFTNCHVSWDTLYFKVAHNWRACF